MLNGITASFFLFPLMKGIKVAFPTDCDFIALLSAYVCPHLTVSRDILLSLNHNPPFFECFCLVYMLCASQSAPSVRWHNESQQ